MLGQEFVKTGSRMVNDAAQHVGELGLRVDVVELGGADERADGGGALAAAVGIGEQPGLAAAMPRSERSAELLVRQMRSSSRKRVKVTQRLSM